MNRRLADRELHIELTDRAIDFVAENSYEPAFGARPLKRYLQKHVETLVARMILSDEVNMGDTIELTVQDGELVGNCR